MGKKQWQRRWSWLNSKPMRNQKSNPLSKDVTHMRSNWFTIRLIFLGVNSTYMCSNIYPRIHDFKNSAHKLICKRIHVHTHTLRACTLSRWCCLIPFEPRVNYITSSSWLEAYQGAGTCQGFIEQRCRGIMEDLRLTVRLSSKGVACVACVASVAYVACVACVNMRFMRYFGLNVQVVGILTGDLIVLKWVSISIQRVVLFSHMLDERLKHNSECSLLYHQTS